MEINMIKAIAVDMDGTFLHSDGDYNHQYFQRIFEQLQTHQIKLVIASGNPYYQLEGQFKAVQDQLAYVAENGVEVLQDGRLISCGQMPTAAIQQVAELHQQIPGSEFILSGYNQAYLMSTGAPDFYEIVIKHYPGMQRINHLAEINEPVVKMQLEVSPQEVLAVQDHINQRIDGVTAVTSGYGNLDLIVSGLDKAAGLQKLCQINQWEPHELMAFGDGQNDVSMLKFAGTSYAMANGMAIAKNIAQELPLTNDQDGVLKTIEAYLIQQYG